MNTSLPSLPIVATLSLIAACSTPGADGFGESAQQTSQTDDVVPTKLPHALGGARGNSRLSSFAPPKKKYPLGLKKTNERRPAKAAGEIKPHALPASVDLSQSAPPAGDQGATGSCATWATGYSAMGWWDARTSLGGAPYAPMFVYAQVVDGDCASGTSIEGDLDIIANEGIDTAADYEPMEQDLDCYTQPSAENMSVAAGYKISDYENPDLGDPRQAIMQELAAGRPVVLGIEVYDNLFNADSENYLVGPPPYGTASEGGHAITGFKYDDSGVWILNSWGSGWGLDGWAVLTWDFIENSSCLDDVVAITGVVGGSSPQPPPQPPGDAGPPPPSGDGPQLGFVSPNDGETFAPGDSFAVVVTMSDADADITDVELQWGYPGGTTTYEMSDLGNGQAEVDLDLVSSAPSGPRTLTVIAMDTQGRQSQVQESVQVQ